MFHLNTVSPSTRLLCTSATQDILLSGLPWASAARRMAPNSAGR